MTYADYNGPRHFINTGFSFSALQMLLSADIWVITNIQIITSADLLNSMVTFTVMAMPVFL